MWRPRLIHLLALIYLAVGLLDGVVLAVRTVSFPDACLNWLGAVDQMVCLLAGLTVFRHPAPRRLAIRD